MLQNEFILDKNSFCFSNYLIIIRTVQFLVAQLGWGRVIGEAIPWHTWCQLTVSSPNRICTAWKCAWGQAWKCAWKCDIVQNVSVTYVTLVPWWRERRRYVPMPQSWTTAGCLGLVLGSSAENLMSGCTCRPFIPVCTGSGSGMQIPLANIHWRFLFTEMIGASR